MRPLSLRAVLACALFFTLIAGLGLPGPVQAATCTTATAPNTVGSTVNATYEATLAVCSAFADVKAVSVSPTVSASPTYSANDVMGGLLTFANFARVSGGGGLIQSVTLHFKTAQTASSDFFWCNGNALSSTTLTDNAAVAVNVADFAACRAIHVTDCTSLGTPTVCTAENLAMPWSLATGTTGYGFLVTRGTPTLGSTSDVTVTVRALRNSD